MKRFEFVEHTADLAVVVYGRTLEELFATAAEAMFSALVIKKKIRGRLPQQEIPFFKQEDSLDILLKAWLDELLYLFLTKKYVFSRVSFFEFQGDNSLRARVVFDHWDPQTHAMHQEIKAVTYHELIVQKTQEGWKARVIFDV